MPIALVTGASAGLGAEFARHLAAQGYDLVLTARDGAGLEEGAATLRADHGVFVEVLAADLLEPSGLAAVEARVGATVNPIDLLVNNAGFGLQKSFAENAIGDEVRLAEIHILVPLRLTHAALQQMLPRSSGTILNVASVAGYTPRGTYGAAKTWMLSFSRWANAFYRGRGVTVTAVAPGFTRTEFHSRMGVTSVDDVPAFLWLTAPHVVRVGLRDAGRGKAISIPSARYTIAVALATLLPTSVVVRMAARGR